MHFLGLAALLFIANALFSDDPREVITVDVATQEYLIEQSQSTMLRDLTDKEKRQAVEDFIEQEVLVREARKRGLENNSRVRSLLIKNMRFFMVSQVPEPTEDDLRAYFDANVDRFATKPSVTYEHVYFADPAEVPGDTLDRLRAGIDHRSIGDTTYQNALLPRAGERQVVTNFGREAAIAILDIDDTEWHGPFESAQGAHFLRVVERHASVRPTYESAGNWLEGEWRMQRTNEIVDRELEEMRENYRIEIATPGDDTE